MRRSPGTTWIGAARLNPSRQAAFSILKTPNIAALPAARMCRKNLGCLKTPTRLPRQSLSVKLRSGQLAHYRAIKNHREPQVIERNTFGGLAPQNETAFSATLGREASRQVPFGIPADGDGADEGLSQRVGAGSHACVPTGHRGVAASHRAATPRAGPGASLRSRNSIRFGRLRLPRIEGI